MRLSARIIIALVFLPSIASALTFDSGGYSGKVDASHLGSLLKLIGRLEGGPSCKCVRIDAQLADERGQLVARTAFVNSWNGFGSLIIESPTIKVSSMKSGWGVKFVNVSCVQK